MKTNTRNYIYFYLNGTPVELSGSQVFLSVSDYLRYKKNLPGTKVVCAEGDCGACTALIAKPEQYLSSKSAISSTNKKNLENIFTTINTCIYRMYQLDGCHLVTVEGLRYPDRLHVAQQALVDKFGSQCGYCTPGFVASMVYLLEQSKLKQEPITEKTAKNFLTGNLCRCTGYQSIIDACISMQGEFETSLVDRYMNQDTRKHLNENLKTPVYIEEGHQSVYLPTMLEQAIGYRVAYPNTRLTAGGSDLGVLINKGKIQQHTLMSLQNIPEQNQIEILDAQIKIGSRVTLAEIENQLSNELPELCRLIRIFASPQIKHTATLVGNVMNASPISDTTPFLMVAEANLEILTSNGVYLLNINELFLGYKKLNLAPTDIVIGIHIPRSRHTFKVFKTSVRKDLDIAIVNLAVAYELSSQTDKTQNSTTGLIMQSFRIAIGGVGPTVIRQTEVETYLSGREFQWTYFETAADILEKHITPITDVRATADYRKMVSKNLLKKVYLESGLV